MIPASVFHGIIVASQSVHRLVRCASFFRTTKTQGHKVALSKPFVFLCAFVSLWFNSLNAQLNTENQYRKPLKEVLNDIQKRYGVQLKYDEKLIADKFVNYAEWRYRTDVEETLDNVLSLFDMIAKKEKDKVYKLEQL